MTSKFTTAAWRLGPHVVPALVLVVTGFLLFPSAGHDDTHITCWPAYTLSRFGQILNYNGDRVEQSSSLLQVLLLAGLHKLTRMDLLTLAKLSSIAFGVGSVLMLFVLVTRAARRTAGFCAAMIAAVSTPIVYWSFSGMETTLVSFAGLWLIVTAADYIAAHPAGSLWKAAVALSAFALVRPETSLLIACFLASALAVALIARADAVPAGIGRPTVVQRALRLLLIGAFVCCALFAFRLTYFGAPFPQPVTAKFSGVSVQNLLTGLHYLKRQAWNDGAATAIVSISIVVSGVLTALGQLRARTPNPYIVLSLLFAVGYLCCAILSGGDWMEGGRFLVHFLPVAIGFVPFVLDGTAGKAWLLPTVTALLVALEGTSAIAFARDASTSIPLWGRMAAEASEVGTGYSWFETHNRINVRDMPLIDRIDALVAQVSARKQGPLLLASGQMGMVPYYISVRHFGRVRFVDRHGLADRALTDCMLTRNVPRDTGGLVLSLVLYFEILPTFDPSCQLGRPDVVFDLRTNAVEAYGYQTVYTQSGGLVVQGTRLTGATVLADAFVAVDSRLLGAMREQLPTHVDFGR